MKNFVADKQFPGQFAINYVVTLERKDSPRPRLQFTIPFYSESSDSIRECLSRQPNLFDIIQILPVPEQHTTMKEYFSKNGGNRD